MTDLKAAARQVAKGEGQALEAVCRALQDDVGRYWAARSVRSARGSFRPGRGWWRPGPATRGVQEGKEGADVDA